MTHPVSPHLPNSEAVRHTLRSRSCVLTRRNASDAAFTRTLWADSVFMRSFHRLALALPVTNHELQRILNVEFQNPVAKSRALHWTVKDPGGRPWGLLSLTDVSLLHKRAEVLLGVLPGAPFGLATAAMLMLFHFYFKTNKFNKLYSIVFADNPHSLKGTLHLGFRQEGLLKGYTFDPHNQTFVDVIHTGIHATEAFGQSNRRLMKKLLQDSPDKDRHLAQSAGPTLSLASEPPKFQPQPLTCREPRTHGNLYQHHRKQHLYRHDWCI